MRIFTSLAVLSLALLVAGQSSSTSSVTSSLISASSTPTSTASAARATVTDITDSENCPSCRNITSIFTGCNVESRLNTTCLCSESIQQQYLGCVECVLQYTDATNASVSSYQALMDAYAAQCASATVSPTTLPAVTVTLPGNSTSAAISTTSASSTSTSSAVVSTSSSASESTTSAPSATSSSPAASPSASPTGHADRANVLTFAAGAGTVLVCLAAAMGV